MKNVGNINFLIFSVPFLMGIGVDLYVPSLPFIKEYYFTSTSFVQLTISLYMLGYGIGQVVFGILSDTYGRKIFLKISIMVFIIVSFLSVFAVNIFYLNLYRFLQGMSVGGLAVIVRAMLVDVFKGTDLYKKTNYFGLSWSLGPILGPFIGSYLQHLFNWQADFYFFAIYGVVVGIYIFVKIPETNKYRTKIQCSIVNIKRILYNRIFVLITMIGGIIYGLIVFFNVVGSFLIQTGLGYSVYEYGNIALILGLSYFAGSIVNRVLLNNFSGIVLLKVGLGGAVFFDICMIILAYIVSINIFIIVVPMIGIFFFGGFIVPNTLAKTMALFPELAGTASALFGTLTGIIVSCVTFLAVNFQVVSQISMAWIYFVLLLVSISLYYLTKILEK